MGFDGLTLRQKHNVEQDAALPQVVEAAHHGPIVGRACIGVAVCGGSDAGPSRQRTQLAGLRHGRTGASVGCWLSLNLVLCSN